MWSLICIGGPFRWVHGLFKRPRCEEEAPQPCIPIPLFHNAIKLCLILSCSSNSKNGPELHTLHVSPQLLYDHPASAILSSESFAVLHHIVHHSKSAHYILELHIQCLELLKQLRMIVCFLSSNAFLLSELDSHVLHYRVELHVCPIGVVQIHPESHIRPIGMVQILLEACIDSIGVLQI